MIAWSRVGGALPTVNGISQVDGLEGSDEREGEGNSPRGGLCVHPERVGLRKEGKGSPERVGRKEDVGVDGVDGADGDGVQEEGSVERRMGQRGDWRGSDKEGKESSPTSRRFRLYPARRAEQMATEERLSGEDVW